jgi:DNA-binding NtrC family response regulator
MAIGRQKSSAMKMYVPKMWDNSRGVPPVSPVILIAEDDAATLAGWAAYVHDAGFSVVPASSFAEAHRLMSFVRPDVLVTDIRLGEYNGLQLVVQAGTLDPAPSVIVTSGFEDPVLAAEAARLGATFLGKPVQPAKLVALITEMVKGRSSANDGRARRAGPGA